MIEMPEIATTEEVAVYLRKSKKRVQNLRAAGLFLDGIVLHNGDFNMSKLKRHIEREGKYLKDAPK